jgi:hypothetical protein
MNEMSNLHADLMSAGIDVDRLLEGMPLCPTCRKPLSVLKIDESDKQLLVCCGNPGCGEPAVNYRRSGTWWIEVPASVRSCDGG